MTIVSIAKTLGSKVFVGATLGRTGHASLLRTLRNSTPGSVVVVDLAGVEVLSASYFREAIAPLVSWCQERGSTLVIANAVPAVLDDIGVALEAYGGAVVVANLLGERIANARVAGKLDDKLHLTLRLVCDAGEADASTIAQASGEPTVVTAWNNRLVALTRMGLLREEKRGKTKYYSPALKGLKHGH
jgi:DNA-binding transcriptional ArsR family regulator